MQISEAESVVMEVLWRGSPRSSEEVIAELSRDQDWQVSTIKTLLGRLVKKGAVKAAKDGRRFSYSPVLTREAWVRGQSSNLLDRLFDGRLAPLIAQAMAYVRGEETPDRREAFDLDALAADEAELAQAPGDRVVRVQVLDRIDENGRVAGEPGLAVLVVRQSDGLPGQGWFVSRTGVYDDLPLEWEGPEAHRYTEARQAEAYDYWETP